jgi:hypothetical protein
VGIHEKDGAVSQRSVEIVIGRLATDEEFRGRFDASREAALDELASAGLPLTPVERSAVLEIDVDACERFATCLDARLQKIDVRTGVDRGVARSTTSRGESTRDEP